MILVLSRSESYIAKSLESKNIYIYSSLQTHESSLHIQPESKIIFAKKKEKGKEVLPLSN